MPNHIPITITYLSQIFLWRLIFVIFFRVASDYQVNKYMNIIYIIDIIKSKIWPPRHRFLFAFKFVSDMHKNSTEIVNPCSVCNQGDEFLYKVQMIHGSTVLNRLKCFEFPPLRSMWISPAWNRKERLLDLSVFNQNCLSEVGLI